MGDAISLRLSPFCRGSTLSPSSSAGPKGCGGVSRWRLSSAFFVALLLRGITASGAPKSQRSRTVNPGDDPDHRWRAALAIFRNAVQAGPNIRHRVGEVAARPDVCASVRDSGAIPAKSVAVLPFENLSVDKDNAYFADGIQDEILTGLAKIGDLKVISRTSTKAYGSRPQNLAEIGRQLGVAHLLEGSVQKAAARVRVNVQLIDAPSDDHLWAETYDRTLEDVFAVETEVAEKIASSLQAQLTRDERAALTKKPTDNPAAYDAFLKARSLLLGSSYDRLNTERILDLLESAVKLDPGYAEAWAQLSITNSGLTGRGSIRQRLHWPRANRRWIGPPRWNRACPECKRRMHYMSISARAISLLR